MSKPEEVDLSHLMMDAADIMAEGAQPSDPRAWRHLLIYCPRELLDARIAELERKRLARIIDGINGCAQIAALPGKYDCNPYTWGMANGLRLAQSIVNAAEVEYLKEPEVWLDEKKGNGNAEIVGDMGATSIKARSTPQTEGESSRSVGAYEPDREAGAGAGGDDSHRDQPRGRTPPDGALC